MIHQQVEADLKSALKSGEKEKTGVLRFLISAIKNHQIEIKAKDEQYLKDEEVIAVIRRQVKQRKDSIAEYEKGGRQELADKEKVEMVILENYLPAQADEVKIREIVKVKIAELGIDKSASSADKSGFGRLMGAVMAELKGQADGDAVKKVVEEELG
ncbi:MAG: GatB/YqeY domain-containing protein [Candidatus Moranbacteria bacterium]|nr:GatB/YqeY domain-containing protein [Candidatus Moranbacteria bacterium]